jgi:hypothetical protein
MATSVKRSRCELTITQKKEICAFKEKNSKSTQEQISEHFSKKWSFHIARRTVGDVLKRKADWEIREAHQLSQKRLKKPKFEVLEETLGMWFTTMQAKKVIISDTILSEKGKDFAIQLQCEDFTASSGWLSRFKSRHDISLKVLHGEAASDNPASVSSGRSELQSVTAAYAPEDIYNMDETGMFYRMPPSKTLAQGPRQGTKQFKDRITVALCTNADGSDSLKPLVGKSAQPRCFKDFMVSNYVSYYHNTKAWMTGYIFSEWLHHFDDYIKRKKNRPVLLLLDNVSSHVTAADTQLQCVRLHFLPPNTTSHLQPLDAGIIKAFKAHYRRSQLQRLIKLLEDDKKPDINLKEAICFLAFAWKSVSTTSIANCWRHTRIIPSHGDTCTEAGYCDYCVQNLSSLLRNDHLRASECMSAGAYLDADASLETEDLPSDDDIISMVTSEGGNTIKADDGDEIEDDSEIRAPSLKQALDAMQLLQNYMDRTGEQDDVWMVLQLQEKLEKNAVNARV